MSMGVQDQRPEVTATTQSMKTPNSGEEPREPASCHWPMRHLAQAESLHSTRHLPMRLFLIAIVSLISFIPLVAAAAWFGLRDLGQSIVALVGGFVVVPALMLRFWRQTPDFDVFQIDPNDPLMCEQMTRARNELHRLDAGLATGELEALVKFPLVTDVGTEHVWAVAHAVADGVYSVSIANSPVGEVAGGLPQRQRVPKSDIEDWMLQDAAGNIEGGYTMYAHARIYLRDNGKLPRRVRADLARFKDFSIS
jgi:uncharacterized protein YegJ (DUF2314 family)